MSAQVSAQFDVLGSVAQPLADGLIALANDIALVISAQGRVLYVAKGGSVALATFAQHWLGRKWSATVEGENCQKIAQLIKETLSIGTGRRREINHLTSGRGTVGVAYTALRLGPKGLLLVVGRDLGVIASMQKRFLDAHQQIEHSAWNARQAEARYRQLFLVATDAVMVADAHSLEILEANQAACELFELPASALIGRLASFGFEKASRASLGAMLTRARDQGLGSEIAVRLLGKVTPTRISISPIGVDESMRLMLRVRTIEFPGTAANLEVTLARLVDSIHDGVVVTDSRGTILIANPSFLRLASMNNERSVKGRPLLDWIGLSEHEFASLLAQVRTQGISTRLITRLLGANAQVRQIEVSAARVSEVEQDCVGFTIHCI